MTPSFDTPARRILALETSQDHDMDGRMIGAMVGAGFGCGWGIVGATGLRRPWALWVGALSIVVTALLITALAASRPPGESGLFRSDVYGIAVTLEALGIFAVVWLLNRFALPQFLMPAIACIVGLHFLGLWQATDLVMFIWIAVAMCLVAGLAVFVPHTGTVDARRVVVGLGSAAVLWAAGLATLL